MTKRIIQYILSGICCLLTVAACLEEKDPLNYSPAVTTGGVTNIGYTNATLAGAIRQNTNSVIADGGILISERSDLEAYTKLEVAASTFSSFSIEAVDLTPGTTYYYCTYANSGYSMVRGEIRNFTTQEGVAPVFGNVEITGHDEKSATLTASIADLGGSELVLCGVRYWEAENGEENVETAGTLATPKLHVTTDEAVLPVLSEIVPLDSTVVSIEVSAQVLDAGKSALKEVGFCWSMESQEPTPSHNHQNLPLPADGEAFTLNIENLTADQTYYIRAYAYNDEEEPGYSPVKIFRTTSSAPIVENAVAENIEYTTATLKARIASHGGLTITAKGFYYSDTNTNPGEGDMQVTATNAQADSIIASVDGLASHTTYYVRAFATNARGTSVSGEVYSFTTADNRTVPTVETAEATNIGSMTATFSGHIAADGNTPVEGNGNDFNWEAEGLSSSTTYYVCAYAENEMGAAYGEVVSFTTEDRVPGIYSLEELLAFHEAAANEGDTSPYVNSDGVTNLYADIDMSSVDNWTPLQGYGNTFNGNGHTISNVHFNYTMSDENRSFSFFVNVNATICNLTITGSYTVSNPENLEYCYVGTFTNESAGIFRNCHSYVDIYAPGCDVGGISCRNFRTIEDCTNHGNLVGQQVGGIFSHGWSDNESLAETRNCTNFGRIESVGSYAGGIAASDIEASIFSHCINEGEIITPHVAGGIVGNAQSSTITNCENKGAVQAESTAGGIAGNLRVLNDISPVYSNNINNGTVNGEPGNDSNAIGYDERNQQ